MGNIFISYAREDKSTALEIYQILQSQRFSIWIDEKNLLPGQDWKAEIEKAIRESAAFIACLSKNSVDKQGFVQAELKRALDVAELMPEGKIFIIPVRLDDCKVPQKLSQYHWLDYFESDSKEKLFQSIRSRVHPAKNVAAEREQFFDAGERIKAVRDELGLKSSQFIELIDVASQREYEAMEAREKEISERLLDQISDVSGVNLEWLKHGEETRYPPLPLSLHPANDPLRRCASLNPQEYILIFEKKRYGIALVAKVGEYRYQVIDIGGMHIDYWNWEEDHWAIPAFYKFLKGLSDRWLGIISTVFLPPQDYQKLLQGNIHYLVAARNGDWRKVGFLEDLLDLEQTRNRPDWYSRIYGGTWLEMVHRIFKERLAEDAIPHARESSWLEKYETYSAKAITFKEPIYLPSQTLKIEWVFPFIVVDSSLKGTPEELGRTEQHEIVVSAPVQLVASWGLFHPANLNNLDEWEHHNPNHDVMKILFWWGKQFVSEKITKGSLQQRDELYLDTNIPHILEPLDISRIPEPSGFTFDV